MVEQVAHTADGRYRVYLHADQTAELSDAKGVLILHRQPVYRIGQWLEDHGFASADLVPE